MCTVAGVDVIVGKYLGPGDVLLAYLPAAHILEFVFENAVLYWVEPWDTAAFVPFPMPMCATAPVISAS
jgi:long-subunit acyl-CoA synthetase (AMP-forming)